MWRENFLFNSVQDYTHHDLTELFIRWQIFCAGDGQILLSYPLHILTFYLILKGFNIGQEMGAVVAEQGWVWLIDKESLKAIKCCHLMYIVQHKRVLLLKVQL